MTTAEPGRLLPYVPRLVSDWLIDDPKATVRLLEGSIVFVDISGFTQLSERLARSGKVGAELVTERLDTVFTELLAVAYGRGGGLLKFGGDALLLWFSGAQHEARACASAMGMRRTLAELERASGTSKTRLRMSVGVHSGLFDFFLVGDSHRELLVAGPAATLTVAMESIATSGQIAISQATADAIPRRYWGEETGLGRLLRGTPAAPPADVVVRGEESTLDVAQAIPLAVRAHLAAGGHEPDHRQATVAFLHFGDVDGSLASAGRQSVAEALGELVALVQHAADVHKVSFLGSDIASDGGKLILVAGSPRATGDHEERMLLTLRQIRDGGTRLPVRMGVNRGHLFAGDVGTSYRRTYTVMGDTVNLAARLMAAAGPGQILATHPVLDHSRTRFQAIALEPFMVKGKARPVEASVVGDLAEPILDADQDELPLVGREDELEVLSHALEDARRRRGQVVQLVGPPGIGKSRLVRELVRRATDFIVIDLHGRMYESSTPYLVVRHLLREALGMRGADGSELLVRLADRIAWDGTEHLPWLPLLGAVLDVPIQDTPETAALEDRFRAARLAPLIASVLDVTLPTPTVFVAEDAHWIDDASASVLSALGASAATRPWLIACVRRDVEGGFDVQEMDGARSVVLRPLEPERAVELVEQATEQAPLSPHEVAVVASRSGGNPLFLLELVRVARASGTAGLPGSIEDVITARIDDLPREDRAVLRYASVLGDSFTRDLLEALLDADRLQIDAAAWRRLDEFIQASEGNVRFRQTLTRDAAYEGLPFRRRRELHARVGMLLMEASATPEEQSELLALHFFYAQAHAEAWRFARIAGRRAQDKFANVEAAQFYAHALESARRLPDTDPSEVATVFEALGDVTERLGDFPQAEASYRSARRLLREPVAQARLLLKEAWIPERMGNYRQALRTITRARRTLAEADMGEVAGQRARLSAAYAAILQAGGRSAEAIRWCRAAMEDAQAGGDDDASAHAFSILSWALASTGQPEHILYAERALEIYERREDLAGQALVLNYLGGYAYFEGRWDEAVELYERGRAARDQTGDAVNAAYGVLNIGEILLDQGHVEEARQRFVTALRVWKAAGHRWGVAAAQSYLGQAAARSGQHDEAVSLLEDARTAFKDLGEASLLEVEVRIAEERLLGGDVDAALTLATELIGRAERGEGMSVHLPTLHRIRGRALVAIGEAEAAREAIELSLESARKRNSPYDAARALQALAELARVTGRGDADALGDEARTILERLGVIADLWPEPMGGRIL